VLSSTSFHWLQQEKEELEGETAERLMILLSRDNLMCGKRKYSTAWNHKALSSNHELHDFKCFG
jgi:hypothetical protein